MKDFSVHFTTKNQTVEQVMNAWYKFENSELFPEELTVSEDNTCFHVVAHHSFLSIPELEKRGIPTDAVEFVETLAETTRCWTVDFPNPTDARREMIDYIASRNGMCFFIGDTTASGVCEELEYAKSLELKIVKINL